MSGRIMHTYRTEAANGPVRTVHVWSLVVNSFDRMYRVTEHTGTGLSDPVTERTFSEYRRAVEYARKVAGVTITPDHEAGGNSFTGELGL
jgi:hypothetical protein